MNDVKENDPDLSGSSNGEGGQEGDDPGQRLIPANRVNEIVSKRVNEVNSKHAESMSRLQGQIDALSKKQSQEVQPPEKTYTRAELDVYVSEGRLSQDESDQIIDKQMTRQITADVTNNLSQQRIQESQQQLIERYIVHDPDIAVQGTDARVRIEAEVRAQHELSGDAEMSLKHEVLALRAIYGDAKNLNKANLNPQDRDTHMDTMTGGQGGTNHQKGSSQVRVDDRGNISGLNRDEKVFYQDLINKGIYTGWKAVAEEMKYSNAALRQRAASR